MAVDSSLCLCGCVRSACDPSTSLSDVVHDATTGVRAIMASSGGKPNPSNSDGYTNTEA